MGRFQAWILTPDFSHDVWLMGVPRSVTILSGGCKHLEQLSAAQLKRSPVCFAKKKPRPPSPFRGSPSWLLCKIYRKT